jgi:hypothetical protein
MTGDWRDYRPAIWSAMLGVAVLLVINPFYWSAVCFGIAIGLAFRIRQRRQRAALVAAADRRPARRRRRGG